MAEDSRNQILCVCTGNICRSPMAEALLRHALAAEDGPAKDLTVVSAGLSAASGQPASENAVRALRSVSLDLTNHRSQPVTPTLLDHALAVFGMTESHRMLLEFEYGPLKAPVFLFREFLPEGSETQVPDPYGSSLAAYEATRDSLVEAVPSLLTWLRENHAAQSS